MRYNGLFNKILTFSARVGVSHYKSSGINFRHTLNNLFAQFQVNASYKDLTLMIRAQTREKWLLGERVEYGALSSLAMVEYNLKPIIVGMGLFYPFTKQWDGGSDLISPVLYQKSWTRIKDNGRMFFLRFSWNFHVGRNYQGGKKTLENQSSSSNLSNMPVVD